MKNSAREQTHAHANRDLSMLLVLWTRRILLVVCPPILVLAGVYLLAGVPLPAPLEAVRASLNVILPVFLLVMILVLARRRPPANQSQPLRGREMENSHGDAER